MKSKSSTKLSCPYCDKVIYLSINDSNLFEKTLYERARLQVEAIEKMRKENAELKKRLEDASR